MIIEQFRSAMLDAGIFYSGEIIADGRLRRFHIDGHKSGTKNGAYKLYGDGRPNGWFQDFTTGLHQIWRSNNRHPSRSPVDLAAFKRQIDEARKQREADQRQKHEEAAAKASLIWRLSKPATEDHAYLRRKNVQPHGARIGRDDCLVLPLHSKDKRRVNLQFITPAGEKRFLSGGEKKGCFLGIGTGKEAKQFLICEGFATGASLHQDSGLPVIVAFDAGNLLPVAKVIRDLVPDDEIIICGDNDLSGVGQDKANAAALAVGGKILIPQTPGNDWNDEINGGAR